MNHIEHVIESAGGSALACVKLLGAESVKPVAQFYKKSERALFMLFKKDKIAFIALVTGYVVISRGYAITHIDKKPLLIKGGQ